MVLITLNPYQGLKRANHLSATPGNHVLITLNPYQGLKRFANSASVSSLGF